MHKTYSDTYKLLGFTGGYWAYADNTNNVSGVSCEKAEESVLPDKQRLALYFLGWESMEVCIHPI